MFCDSNAKQIDVMNHISKRISSDYIILDKKQLITSHISSYYLIRYKLRFKSG